MHANGLFCAYEYLGVKQYYQKVPEGTTPYHTFEQKATRLFEILRKVAFHQCVVFCNNRPRAQDLSDRLNKYVYFNCRNIFFYLYIIREGWASAYIAGGQVQEDRNYTMKSLRDFQLRILVSTDLVCRCISPVSFDLTFNLHRRLQEE